MCVYKTTMRRLHTKIIFPFCCREIYQHTSERESNFSYVIGSERKKILSDTRCHILWHGKRFLTPPAYLFILFMCVMKILKFAHDLCGEGKKEN